MHFADLTSASDPFWATAFPVLQELRPHLTMPGLQAIVSDGSTQGLTFTAAFEFGTRPEHQEEPESAPAGRYCVAIAGWRMMATTSVGRKIYVDDLSTSSMYRSHGYGSLLLAEISRRGTEMGCTTMELDSGVQRFDAHRFYLRERMNIVSHHFSVPLPAKGSDCAQAAPDHLHPDPRPTRPAH